MLEKVTARRYARRACRCCLGDGGSLGCTRGGACFGRDRGRVTYRDSVACMAYVQLYGRSRVYGYISLTGDKLIHKKCLSSIPASLSAPLAPPSNPCKYQPIPYASSFSRSLYRVYTIVGIFLPDQPNHHTQSLTSTYCLSCLTIA